MDLVTVIKKLWDAWDVRVMILLSLLLQAILFILGNRRKYTVKPWVGILLWLAYQCADPVAIAALGMLSSSCVRESGVSNTLKGWWASLLLLHLGGPDTITAYSMEDNLLWKRHLLGLVVQVALAVYVVVLSWTTSWLSLLNFPLFLVGVIKYSERTWCLYSATSKDSRQKAPLLDDNFFENIGDCEGQMNQMDVEKVFIAYLWYALMRHDIKNIFSTTINFRSSQARMAEHIGHVVRQTFQLIRRSVEHDDMSRGHYVFDKVAIVSGFMFDMLYTKSAIVFSKLGCILRLINLCCSSLVLVFFFNSFCTGNSPQQYRSRVDICVTGILLAGAVAFEFYGLFLILSSDWFVVLGVREDKNRVLRGVFRWSLLKHREKKRWSDCMGQFNLLRYCQSFRKGTKILQVIGIDELMHKYRNTSFRCIPLSLKKPKNFPNPVLDMMGLGLQRASDISSHFYRGEKALQRYNCRDETMKNTLSMDLSATVIIWHIATDICYAHPMLSPTDERVITCKAISNYMMYLVANKPSMISEDDNFWFDSVSRNLRKKLQPEDDATIDRQLLEKISQEQDVGVPSSFILEQATKVAKVLSSRAEQQWDIMGSVWLEMMHYAAIRCPHVSHLQQLSQGGEILSLYWLLASYNMYNV